VVFKATSSSKGKAKQESSSEDEDLSFDKMNDEKMALFVERFGKFMVRKDYYARWKKSSSKNKEESRKCFKCRSKDHLIAQCPYNSDNDDDDKKSKKDKKKKKENDKMTIKKKKKGGSYVVTWDSDVSSSDDDSDNDKTTKKKTLASIAINKKPSLFDTPSCFMAKATKVQTCDVEHDNESESYNDDEPTKDELINMLEDAKEHFDIKRRECKDLHKELKALKQAFDELNSSHERIEKAHEKLGKTYKKLEKAHSSLLNEQNEKEHVVTCDKGLTCDIIDESFYKPIIVAPTNPSSSTSTFISSNSDGFTCDASLMVDNETLKKEVNELTPPYVLGYPKSFPL
jgi:arsenate reductase-like glutaredoxin family protein